MRQDPADVAAHAPRSPRIIPEPLQPPPSGPPNTIHPPPAFRQVLVGGDPNWKHPRPPMMGGSANQWVFPGSTLNLIVPPGYIDPHNWTATGSVAGGGVDWLNVVTVYGADPTGATDSTAAIQAAINANKAPVFFPSGAYVISSPLTLLAGTILIGNNCGGSGAPVTPGPTWSTIKLANGSNCSMVVAPAGADFCRISGLDFECNGPNQTGPVQTTTTGAAIHFADAPANVEGQSIIEECRITDAFNDAVYLGLNRRYQYLRRVMINLPGNGTTVYGVGNGVTVNAADCTLDTVAANHANHNGVQVKAGRTHLRIRNGDYSQAGQDWASAGPTTVAAGSNGVLVNTFTGTQSLSVASTAGFPVPGSLYVNIAGAPAVIAYTGTSGGNTFTNCTTSLTAGLTTGTLATGQNVYVFGGSGIYVETGTTGITIGSGNELDRGQGCSVYVESGQISVMIQGNLFIPGSQISSGLLPAVQLIQPNQRVAVVGNAMGQSVTGFPNLFSYAVNAYGTNATNNQNWLDAANLWLTGATTNVNYTPNSPGPTLSSNMTMREFTNSKQGIAVLVGGTVTVANTSVTANSRIMLTSQLDGGTPGFLRVSTRTANTSFTILSSSNTDTSTVAYEIFEPGF